MRIRPHLTLSLAAAALLAPGCMSLEYDLGGVPVEVTAKPPAGDADAEPFRVQAKDVLWAHGLFGRSEPDVATLLTEAAGSHAEVTDFRVTHGAGFHDWLVTHLTLTLVRMKTVVIEGRLVGER